MMMKRVDDLPNVEEYETIHHVQPNTAHLDCTQNNQISPLDTKERQRIGRFKSKFR